MTTPNPTMPTRPWRSAEGAAEEDRAGLERHGHLPVAGVRWAVARHLQEVRPRRRTAQLRRLDRALLEAIATGKADGGVGMALRWLKALEQGFDVKITAGTHGGCSRLVALKSTPASPSSSSSRARRSAFPIWPAPARISSRSCCTRTASIRSADVEWRQYPGELLQLAAEKGEIHAIADGDPKAYFWLQRRPNYTADRVQSRSTVSRTASAASSACAAA